jgi:hypothetical protein
MVTEEKKKNVGEYIVLMMLFYEGGYAGDRRWNNKLFFKDAEISVHVKGVKKGLVERRSYISEREAKRVYNKLNSEIAIAEWIEGKF